MKLTQTFVLLSMAISLGACSYLQTRHATETKMEQAKPAAENPKSTDVKAAEVKAETKPEDKTTEASVTAAPAVGLLATDTNPKDDKKAETEKTKAELSADIDKLTKKTEDTGVSAEKSLTWLKNGNTRFMKGYVRKDGQAIADVRRLAKEGQKPHAIILSCSDSRVPPELVFDQKLGEVFVIRTAGPNIDSSSIASIEYAVEAFNSHLLVVMGHTYCGAVQAAMSTFDKADAGSPSLNALVGAMHPRLAAFKDHPSSEGQPEEAWANTNGVAKELLEKSALIKAAVDEGSLRIQSAVYDTAHGRVDFEAPKQN